MLVLLAIVGGLVVAAMGGRPVEAQRPRIFSGSLVLEDVRPLSVVDMASATVTVRLEGVDAEVGARSYDDVEAVPVQGGTVLVNRRNGTFNLLEPDDYVLDPQGSGVGLGPLRGLVGAAGYAAGPDAYILRQAPSSTVSLVGPGTIAAASHSDSRDSIVHPIGFAALHGSVSVEPGAGTVQGGDLWVLESVPGGCVLDRLSPGPSRRLGLVTVSELKGAARCGASSLETAPGVVGWASPGRVTMFSAASPERRALQVVELPALASASRFLPVSDPVGGLWFLGRTASGWSLVGVSPAGRQLGPYALPAFGPSSLPAVPAMSAGLMYTLDTHARGQPSLWVVDPATGREAPVAGAGYYPRRSPLEDAGFSGAKVVVDGPRVVFNNPDSLDAVVVFTDGTRPPAVVDKSAAVFVSAAGPADLNVTPVHRTSRPGHGAPPPPEALPPAARVLPVIQPVNPDVSCETTDQKPYAPVVTSVEPSSGAALVTWSYELLDQTDCEPDSWSVAVTAIKGPQPPEAVQLVDGQSQYLFTGLRPATPYRVAVTAYLNTESTSSAAVGFVTSARGPDAPLSVTTAADGQGDWIVSWKPCGPDDRSTCVVPADTWTVRGAACGTSFISQPPAVVVPGGATSVTVSASQLGLLGDSASFSVSGSTAAGLAGDPTSDHACTTAWQPPDASAIALSASGTPDGSGGSTITAHLEVSVSGPSTEALGSTDTEYVYSIGGTTVGPTSQMSVTVPGLEAGRVYDASVEVYPAGHTGASVSIAADALTTTLPWPSALGVTVTPTIAADPNEGSLTIIFPGAPQRALVARGGTIQCGGPGGTTMAVSGPLSGGSLTLGPVDLDAVGGACTLSGLTLVDEASPDPYGVPSPTLETSFELGHQPAYAFGTSWSPCPPDATACPPQVDVTVDGPEAPAAGDSWLVSATGPGGPDDPCQVSRGPTATTPFVSPVPDDTTAAPPPSVVLTLPDGCSDTSRIDVSVSYRYLGVTTRLDLGSPPGIPPAPTTTTTTSTTTTTTTVPVPTTVPPPTTVPGTGDGSTTTTVPSSPVVTDPGSPPGPGTTPSTSAPSTSPGQSAPAGSTATAAVAGGSLAFVPVLGTLVTSACRRRKARHRNGNETTRPHGRDETGH
jgi:hypothetical protein